MIDNEYEVVKDKKNGSFRKIKKEIKDGVIDMKKRDEFDNKNGKVKKL
jgi:hypothetical protein